MKKLRVVAYAILILWFGTMLVQAVPAVRPLREWMERAFIADAARGNRVRMQLWLWAGVFVHSRTFEGDYRHKPASALTAAAENNRADAVRFLLDRGACERGCPGAGRAAAKGRHFEIVELLDARGALDLKDGADDLLYAAADAGDVRTVEWMLTRRLVEGGLKEKALRHAIIHDRPEVVSLLLDAGANVNDLHPMEVEKGVPTILEVARSYNNPAVIRVVEAAGPR